MSRASAALLACGLRGRGLSTLGASLPLPVLPPSARPKSPSSALDSAYTLNSLVLFLTRCNSSSPSRPSRFSATASVTSDEQLDALRRRRVRAPTHLSLRRRVRRPGLSGTTVLCPGPTQDLCRPVHDGAGQIRYRVWNNPRPAEILAGCLPGLAGFLDAACTVNQVPCHRHPGTSPSRAAARVLASNSWVGRRICSIKPPIRRLAASCLQVSPFASSDPPPAVCPSPDSYDDRGFALLFDHLAPSAGNRSTAGERVGAESFDCVWVARGVLRVSFSNSIHPMTPRPARTAASRDGMARGGDDAALHAQSCPFRLDLLAVRSRDHGLTVLLCIDPPCTSKWAMAQVCGGAVRRQTGVQSRVGGLWGGLPMEPLSWGGAGAVGSVLRRVARHRVAVRGGFSPALSEALASLIIDLRRGGPST